MFVPWSFFLYILVILATRAINLFFLVYFMKIKVLLAFVLFFVSSSTSYTANLLNNAGFDELPALTGWTRSGTLSSGVVTSPVTNAPYAARISTSASTGNKALYQNVNVYEGKRYVLSGYVYLVVAQGGESVGLGLKPGGGGVASSWFPDVSNSTSATTQDRWVYLTLSTKVPFGVSTYGINVYLRTSGALSTWATGYFDDISFVFISSPPGKVTDFVAETGRVGGEINLSWVCATATIGYEDDLPPGCSFYIQYASWTGVNFSTLTLPNPPPGVYHIWIPTGPVVYGTNCYYTIAGLQEGVTYYFRIWVIDNSGNWSEISDSATTQAQITPQPPSNLDVFSISSSTIRLKWTPSNAVWYRIEHSSVSNSESWVFRSTVVAKAGEYIDDNLVPSCTYWYRMFGINSAGIVNWYQPSNIVKTITYPAAPINFTTQTISATSIVWIWEPIGYADGFIIYQATSPNTEVVKIPFGINTYEETGLSTNTAYGRYIRAFNSSGFSELSAKTTVYTLAATPVNLSFIAVHYTSVTFSWSANGNPLGTRYEVSQSIDNFQTNFSTPIPYTYETVVTISDLVPSTTYYFRVRAFNNDDVPTSFSIVINTTTLSLPPPDICITEVLANDSHSTEGPGEFVEVYNRGLVEVDLAGMFLCGEGDTNDNIVDYTGHNDLGQPGTILYPGWYALIVDPDYDGWYNDCIQQHADLNKLIMLTIHQDSTLGSSRLANTFESVWIVSGTVVLTSFTWVSDAGNGKSWEKIDYLGPAIDRSDSCNWAVSTHQSDNNSYCTPGFLNSVSGSGPPPLLPSQEDINPSDVVINEFLYDAVSTDNGNEWIELYNNLSTMSVNLAGWKIQKSTGPTLDVAVWTDLFVITSGSISPNGYFLCAQSTAAVKYQADFTYSDSATMNNSAPSAIRLVTPSGKEIDRVAYGGARSDNLAEADKATVGVSVGQSLSRSPDGKDTNNNYNDFIMLSNPTPTNSSGPDKIPPASITDLAAETGQNPGEIILSWTAPGDDGLLYNNTKEAYYIVKYATYPVKESTAIWWQQAVEYVQQWNVASQGLKEQKVLQGFIPGTTYYFAIKTVDDSRNVSDIDINAQDLSTQAKAYAQVGSIGSLIRINEVAPDQTSTAGYDWIEFYNTSTQAINVFGWKIYEVYTSSTEPIEIIEANWFFPANSYLVLRFGQQQRNMTVPQQISPNCYELYTDKPGLAATDNIIVLADKNDNWIDVVCYTDRSGSISNATRFRQAYNYAVSINEWYGPYADETNDDEIEYCCASTLFMSSDRSLARDESSTDGTNPSVNEWYLTLTLTCGAPNSGIDKIPPAAVTTLQATAGPNRGQVKLSWISVGNDDYTGTAAGYMLRFNTFPITEENFFHSSTNADRISKDKKTDTIYMKPKIAGKIETTVGVLPVGQTYYFALKVLDERVNFSAISNVVSFVPPNVVGSNIRINEFAVLESTHTGGDWVELYNASEDPVNIKGWTLWGIKVAETTPSKIKKFPDITLAPKDYLVVNCVLGTDETTSKGENGYWDVYTNYDIKGFDGVLFLTDEGFSSDYDNIVDFVAYTSGGVSSWKDIWNTACDCNQWSPYINTDAEGVNYAVDWSSGQTGFSLGRDRFSTDTDNILHNARDDWKLFRVPTKGYQNDDIPPAAITYIVATYGETEGSIKLTWIVPGDDEFIGVNYGKYEIKYATFTVETSSTVWWQQISKRSEYSGVVEVKIGVDISTTQPYETVSYTITRLFPGLTYYFGIRTYDDIGNVSELDLYLSNNEPVFAVAFDTIPAKVQNLNFFVKNKTIEFSWDKNKELDFDRYEIYCDSGVGLFFVSATTNTWFEHRGLKNGLTYYYELYAVDIKQNKSLPTFGYTIPKMSPPTKLSAEHYGWYVNLEWQHSVDYTADNFLMYKIYRSSSQHGSYVSISTTTNNFYKDNNIQKGSCYYYYIVCVDNDYIESELSNIAVAVPDLISPKFVHISKLTSRDLAKDIAKIDIKVVDDRFEEGDRQGKLVSLEGKYKVIGSQEKYSVKFDPDFIAGLKEYTGQAEFDFTLITIGDKGIEYQFIAKDEVNISSFPIDGSWYKVELPKDLPQQKFITDQNPEVVFGSNVEEVIIYDQFGNKVWGKTKQFENQLIVWKGKDKNDKNVESGTYIYQIKTKDGKRKYGVVIVVK